MEKEEILIEDLNVEHLTKTILINAGYITVGDLMRTKKEVVEALFNTPVLSRRFYDGSLLFQQLKSSLHYKLNVTFLEEYDEMMLPVEIANTAISKLGLPTPIKNILIRRLAIYTLGDLLTTEYSTLIKARNLGSKYMSILKGYIHELGYTLKNEVPTLEEKIAGLKENGVFLLEYVIPNPRVYMALYRNGIYTLDELLNCDVDVCDFNGIGPMRKKEIEEFLKLQGVSFKMATENGTVKSKKTSEVADSVYGMIDSLSEEVGELKERINAKNSLVAEYNRLIEERKSLLAKEKELDKAIAEKSKLLAEENVYVKKRN